MTSSSVRVSIFAHTAPISMSELASVRVTLATLETASLRAVTFGGTTALMHFIQSGF